MLFNSQQERVSCFRIFKNFTYCFLAGLGFLHNNTKFR
jgi:hypothetical protein